MLKMYANMLIDGSIFNLNFIIFIFNLAFMKFNCTNLSLCLVCVRVKGLYKINFQVLNIDKKKAKQL